MQPSPMPIPEGLDIIQTPQSAIIRRTWFSHMVWFLIFFCIFWDGFLIFWYTGALAGASRGGSHMLPFLLFPLIHVAVGVGLTYFVVCMFVNKTDILIEASTLTIKTHPLPWLGNKSLPAESMTRFLVRERFTQSENSTRVSYSIYYVDVTNREKRLVTGLKTREQADYIATSLTRYYLPAQAA
ncbi:hypothetical protein DB345_05715 [Spartobacteria bacterium LR76]|nr:hypothetical protein DB345_05715 [Spartobacteria bacterium LR76]